MKFLSNLKNINITTNTKIGIITSYTTSIGVFVIFSLELVKKKFCTNI